MRISLLSIGKTSTPYIREGISTYSKRINHYLPFEIKELEGNKKWGKLPVDLQQNKESELLIKEAGERSTLILLDEKGKTFSSHGFAKFIQQQMNTGPGEICFITGGAYGVSNDLRIQVSHIISLSHMTFPHQLIRLIFSEQLYRVLTIINGEKYHH